MNDYVSLPNDHFFRKETKVLEDFKKVEHVNIIEDVSELFTNFDYRYDKLLKRQHKTNVLITGITGVGKSSLINSIFGREMALTGTGKPVTQHFTKYSSEYFPVNIFDSKGLEHGNSKNFIKTTKKFLKHHKVGKNGESENAIHVIWYIINSAFGRWQTFEESICKKLFKNIPIIFILNKADLTSYNDRNYLKKSIENMKIDNCYGIFDVVSVENTLKHLAKCSKCHSDDIIIRKKLSIGKCNDCNFIESLKMDNGRIELVKATYQILPSFVKNAFTMAQKVSFSLKERNSLVIIRNFWERWYHVYTVGNFLKIIANMMITLSMNWNFKHSNEYAKFVAKDLVKVFTISDKVKLLFHNNTYKQKLHCTSLGILWNRCLWYLNQYVFNEWSKSEDNNDEMNVCKNKVDCALLDFNCNNLAKIEYELDDYGLSSFLLEEFNKRIE